MLIYDILYLGIILLRQKGFLYFIQEQFSAETLIQVSCLVFVKLEPLRLCHKQAIVILSF